ncbi:MAG: pilin [Candidatus Pacebacteria bacterium]|nr:pilin [Candidatus Paceibacterota bacterium]
MLLFFFNNKFADSASAASPACTGTVDVVFYIDTSGSMSVEWTTVCENIASIASGIEAKGNTVNYYIYQLGSCGETGSCVDGTIAMDCESWGPATTWVANNYPWSADSKRIAVPMSDECPYLGDSCNTLDSVSITDAIAAANANNVIVSPIISTGGVPYAHGTDLASSTNGTISNASTSAGIVTAITTLITNEMGDIDGDGSLSPACGGDDCDDSNASIFPGEACYNQCFDKVLMAGTCVVSGTGECIYDTEIATCENMGDVCKLDSCKKIEGGNDICVADFSDEDFCGGLVPCGRMIDDPSTTDIDETGECSFCHLALLANNTMKYLIGIASTLALLAIIIAGLLYVTSGENVEKRTQAKTYLSAIIKGYVTIFAAWLIVDFVLSVWGFIDPVGGSWDVVCEYLYVLMR